MDLGEEGGGRGVFKQIKPGFKFPNLWRRRRVGGIEKAKII